MDGSYVMRRDFFAMTENEDGSKTLTLFGSVEYDPPFRGAQGVHKALIVSDPARIEGIRQALREGKL
jgi:hypothetical protein